MIMLGRCLGKIRGQRRSCPSFSRLGKTFFLSWFSVGKTSLYHWYHIDFLRCAPNNLQEGSVAQPAFSGESPFHLFSSSANFSFSIVWMSIFQTFIYQVSTFVQTFIYQVPKIQQQQKPNLHNFFKAKYQIQICEHVKNKRGRGIWPEQCLH